MKSKCIGKWTITKPTNADGSGGYTTYDTSDVEEVRAAGRRGWGVSPHIEVDFGDDPAIDDRSLEEAAVVGYSRGAADTNPVRDVVEAWDAYFPDRTNEQAAVLFVLAMNKLREAFNRAAMNAAQKPMPYHSFEKCAEEVWRDLADASSRQEPVAWITEAKYPAPRFVIGSTDPSDVWKQAYTPLCAHPSAEIAALRERIAGMEKELGPRHWNPVYNTDPVQRACGELPEGVEIEIQLERDSGTVYLVDNNCGERHMIDDADTFDWTVHKAIDAAIHREKSNG